MSNQATVNKIQHTRCSCPDCDFTQCRCHDNETHLDKRVRTRSAWHFKANMPRQIDTDGKLITDLNAKIIALREELRVTKNMLVDVAHG